MNTTPLDIAVQQIIANSHLNNDGYSYYYIGALSTLNPNTVNYPIVTSVNNVSYFDASKVYTQLRISIIFQKPNIEICEDRLIYQNQMINYAHLYVYDIMEIAYWLTGKYKLPGNKRIIDDVFFSESNRSSIQVYVGGEIKDENDNVLLGDDIVIVEGVLQLEGYAPSICKPIFNPEPIC